MQPQTILFHGISGAGKGTQAQLLKHYLEDKDPQRPVIYLSTGQEFRRFMEGTSFASRKVKAMLEKGQLLPDFLPVWIWTDCLNRYIATGAEHVILDGAVRRVHEAPMMESALDFFERENPAVVILNVSRARAIEHLSRRGRYDDNEADIKARLDWYEVNVVPALNYFRNNSRYRVFDINGEQGIEEVHREILGKLGI